MLLLFLLLVKGIQYFKKCLLEPLWRLSKLQHQMLSTSENSTFLGNKYLSLNNKAIFQPLDNNMIESRLRMIIDEADSLEIIFVFDELDKLSGVTVDDSEVNTDVIKELRLRKQQVDSVLGDLKNLITSSKSIYIFIAGRDMYDAYLSERGSSNSLYESLFNDHIYISSFLTDRSNREVYLLDSMIEAFVVSNLIPIEYAEKVLRNGEAGKETIEDKYDSSYLKLSDYVDYKRGIEEENLEKEITKEKLTNADKKAREEIIESCLIEEVYTLKTFIHFLTLHSWGNCKRLFTLFESFARPLFKSFVRPYLFFFLKKTDQKIYRLSFFTKDIQRLVLASHLYILFHHNLSRMLMNADDKLVVSSFSVFHYILKYHGIGFSRGHILRMYETIHIHSSPELTRIVDIIIHNVLRNHVRKVRNSFYRYRFSYLHEQEIHFITTISDGESAVFNFSLNAMDAVKQHYTESY